MNQSLKSTVKNVFVALMVTAVLNFGLPVYNTASAATPRFEKKSVSIYLGKTKALD